MFTNSTYEIYDLDYRSKKEKQSYWNIAKGLQTVDGLQTSDYLNDLVEQNIQGNITHYELKNKLNEYYKIKENRSKPTKEADLVSANINEVLNQNGFVFSPQTLLNIHYALFSGTFAFAGKIRDADIKKSEWVLDGDTVIYASYLEIRDTLQYDFSTEQNSSYAKMSKEQFLKKFSRFIANIWQIHPFFEGNTRTTAVFTIKYLNKLGFQTTNDLFKENSLYFRNSLVRANYSNLPKGITEDTTPLEQFFDYLILKENNSKNILFSNRDLHICKPNQQKVFKPKGLELKTQAKSQPNPGKDQR